MVDDEELLEDDDENLVELEDIEYSRKADLSKAVIVKDAMDKVKDKRANEMRSGYWNMSISKDGSVKKAYVPDTRKEYVGSMEHLKGTLNPEIKSSKKAQEALKSFEKEKQELLDKYSVNAVSVFNNQIVEISEKYIPDVDEIFPEEIILTDKKLRMKGREVIQRKGLYNWKTKMYWDKMVIIYDKLFGVLNDLIAEKEFFKSKSSF